MYLDKCLSDAMTHVRVLVLAVLKEAQVLVSSSQRPTAGGTSPHEQLTRQQAQLAAGRVLIENVSSGGRAPGPSYRGPVSGVGGAPGPRAPPPVVRARPGRYHPHPGPLSAVSTSKGRVAVCL